MNLLISILSKLGMKVLSEIIIKKIIMLGLETLVKKTKSDVDDKLLIIVKEAWSLEAK